MTSIITKLLKHETYNNIYTKQQLPASSSHAHTHTHTLYNFNNNTHSILIFSLVPAQFCINICV